MCKAYEIMDILTGKFPPPPPPPCPPDKCCNTGFEVAKVSLPIEILPQTFVGDVDVDCFGEPCVTCECDPCGSSCRVVITQRIKIKIPYKIGVKAITGCSNIFCFPLGCEEADKAEDEKK